MYLICVCVKERSGDNVYQSTFTDDDLEAAQNDPFFMNECHCACVCVCYMRSCLITLILTYMWTMLKRHGPGSKQVLNAHGSCRCGLQLSKHFTVIPV